MEKLHEYLQFIDDFKWPWVGEIKRKWENIFTWIKMKTHKKQLNLYREFYIIKINVYIIKRKNVENQDIESETVGMGSKQSVAL